MKKLELKEIQNVGLNILKHIKQLCEENNIKYYLAYGTIIGAIRHGGFIPWDDDIDIYMTRAEYNKFLEVTKRDKSKYKLMSVETNNDYQHPLVKYVDTTTSMDWHVAKYQPNYGIWVDIFVLDNVTDNNLELKVFQFVLNKLQRFYGHSLYKRRKLNSLGAWKNLLLYSWTSCFKPRTFAKMMYRLSQIYNNRDTKRFAPSAFTASSRAQAVLRKDLIGNGSTIMFEGIEFPAPEKIDEYLRHFYGDYMQLPPEEKRKSNHTADFYQL